MTHQNHPIFVLIHRGCQDGLGGKYAAWKKFGDAATYIPVSYGHPLPEIPDHSEVYIIDFSYDKATLEALNARCSKVVVLDHHKSAEAALRDLDFAFFDMNRSGAVMAWNYFHPDDPVPEILKRVQDRDLWRWQYKDTEQVTSAMQLLGDDMAEWDTYVNSEQWGISDLVSQGKIIQRYKDHVIDRVCRQYNVTFRAWNGLDIAIVNSSDLQDDVSAYLYEKYPVDYVIIYSLNGEGRVRISLRSKDPTGADVSEIAKLYGGGGHKHSAGCTASSTIIKEWYSSPIVTYQD